jgi:DNA-directed RNA polymerase specialized sigma24 family protein
VLHNLWLSRKIRYERRIVTDIPNIDRLSDDNCSCFDPHDVYGRKIDQEHLQGAIARPPPRLQEIIILREFHDWTLLMSASASSEMFL